VGSVLTIIHKKKDPVSSLTKASALDNDDDSSIELSNLFNQVYTKSLEESEVSEHKPAQLAPALSGAKAHSKPAHSEVNFSNVPTVAQIPHNCESCLVSQSQHKTAKGPIAMVKEYHDGSLLTSQEARALQGQTHQEVHAETPQSM
jgi:hypothetical protein